MGSFSELVMSFPLRRDVDDDVLASFASIAVPHPDAPPLPPANSDEQWDWLLDYEPDCDMSDPWSHDWGAWLGLDGTVAYIGSDQGATMVWRRNHWVVTSRATWKSSPEEFVNNLAILGTVIDASGIPRDDTFRGDSNQSTAGTVATGFFVGYTRHEYDPQPWLLWADGLALHAEDLNTSAQLGTRSRPTSESAASAALRKDLRRVGRRVWAMSEPTSDTSSDGGETADTVQVVEEAIRRTLNSPQLYFVRYSIQSSDTGWSASKVCGWWIRDEAELFTETAHRRGQEMFAPDWRHLDPRESASCSLIRGAQRHTWSRSDERAQGGVVARKSCVQRIDDAPNTPRELVERWRTAVDEYVADGLTYLTIPSPETTPMEIMAALLSDGCELVDVPAEHQRPSRHQIRFRGTMSDSQRQSRQRLWRGSIWTDDDGFVDGVTLRANGHTWTFSIGHADDFERPKATVPGYVAKPIELHSLLSVGDEVVMPSHPFEIAASAQDAETNNNFWVLVEGDETEAISAALTNAAPRILWLTYMGRELTTETDRDLILGFEIRTPKGVNDPQPDGGGIILYSDWRGKIGPSAARSCVAIVVQELLAAGVTDARLSN